MNKYDPDKECPKCGFYMVTTEYQSKFTLRRDCRRCKNVWYEATLDAPDEEDK